MTLRLFVGNQRFSSWSMRPWLALEASGLSFETVVLPFDDPDFKSKVPSAAGQVPVLVDGDLVVHESLAICEHVAELAPAAALWPVDRAERARARAIAAEMHAGFPGVRNECSMDVCRAEAAGAWPVSAGTRREITRLDALFASAAGPFLFGRFGIVDAMLAPVVTRFLSYGLPISDAARPYVDAVRALPAVERWYRAGARERDLGWKHHATDHVAPLGLERATEHAVRWAEAWNRRDVDAVLQHFAEDVVFTSPRAKEVVGDAVVRGKAALRAYWGAAVAQMPAELRFEIVRASPCPETSTLVIEYLRHGGGAPTSASEVLTFDARGRVIAGAAYRGV